MGVLVSHLPPTWMDSGWSARATNTGAMGRGRVLGGSRHDDADQHCHGTVDEQDIIDQGRDHGDHLDHDVDRPNSGSPAPRAAFVCVALVARSHSSHGMTVSAGQQRSQRCTLPR
jgi:hypothetical protein